MAVVKKDGYNQVTYPAPQPVKTLSPAVSGGPSTGLARPIPYSRWGDTIGSVHSTSLPSLPDPGESNPNPITQSDSVVNPGYNGSLVDGLTGQSGGVLDQPTGTAADNNIYGGNMTGGYTAAGYSDLLYNDPGAVAADFLAQMGITNEDAIGLMQPLVEVASLLEAIAQGGTPGYSPTASDLQGFVNDLLTQMSTPNGQSLDANAIYDMMMNTDPNSLLGQAMSKMTPDQINNMIMGVATAAIPNPYLQRGVQASNTANAREYNTSIAKGGSTSGNSYFDQVKGGQYGGYFGAQ